MKKTDEQIEVLAKAIDELRPEISKLYGREATTKEVVEFMTFWARARKRYGDLVGDAEALKAVMEAECAEHDQH